MVVHTSDEGSEATEGPLYLAGMRKIEFLVNVSGMLGHLDVTVAGLAIVENLVANTEWPVLDY